MGSHWRRLVSVACLAGLSGWASASAERPAQAPFSAVLDGDMKALAASGEKGLVQLRLATHTPFQK
jgi:hypothetical protein